MSTLQENTNPSTSHNNVTILDNILTELLNALDSNPLKITKTMVKYSLYFQDYLFLRKIQKFFTGIQLTKEDQLKLCSKLIEYGTKEENFYRLLEIINKADTEGKIHYIINATRCLLSDFIDIQLYFRICAAITNNLYEDLKFLEQHIFESDIPYEYPVQGLYSTGLMYQSVLGQDTKYSFTPIARDVDRFALSYQNVERYPNPLVKQQYSSDTPNTDIVLSTTTNEKIDNLFK